MDNVTNVNIHTNTHVNTHANDNIPQLVLMCGCNGAGKSTFTYSTLEKGKDAFYIDPDRIAKEEHCSPMQAGRTALALTKKYIMDKQDFLKESTLSSQSDLKLIREAQDAGFCVTLNYIGLGSADRAVDRVSDRHKKGGHTVPEEDIRRRYERSLENMPKAIALADKVNVIDNTKNRYASVASFEKGKLQSQTFSPTWFEKTQKTLGTNS